MARRIPSSSREASRPVGQPRRRAPWRRWSLWVGLTCLIPSPACGNAAASAPPSDLCSVVLPLRTWVANGGSVADLVTSAASTEDPAIVADLARRYARHPGGVGRFDQVLLHLARRSSTPTVDSEVPREPTAELVGQARQLDRFLRTGAC